MNRRPVITILLFLIALAAVGLFTLFLRQRMATHRARLAPHVVAAQPILPGQSLGPISLGMTEAQVTAALGQPDTVQSPQVWQYRDPDIAINFSKTTPRTVAAIFAGGAPPLTNVPYRTSEGLGLGSTRDEFIKAWGAPDTETPETLTYRSRGIVLMHKNGTITWLAIRTFSATQPATQAAH